MYPKKLTLRIITYRSNPLYQNPKASELIPGNTVIFSTEIGTTEVKINVVAEHGMGKPLPYRIKGKVFRAGRPTANCDIDYDPVSGSGNITIEHF